MKVIVKQIEQACERIKLFELQHPQGEALPAFSAGAHIDVHLGNGLVRQYSLSNAPHERHRYVIGVLQDAQSRGGSQFVHQNIQVGDELEISAPRNLFAMNEKQQRALLFAGGIGITPLMAMAESLLQQGIDFQLAYFCRSADDIAFKQRLAQADIADKVRFVHQENGQSTTAIADLIAEANDTTHLYTCGPVGFMEAVFAAAKDKAWQDANLHKESFQAAVQDSSTQKSFQIKIASSGDVIDIPAGQSITQILEDAGYFIPVSCEQGICGTCMTNVLEGEPEHCDQFLTDEERASNKVFTPCCSRARSDLLVLDL